MPRRSAERTVLANRNASNSRRRRAPRSGSAAKRSGSPKAALRHGAKSLPGAIDLVGRLHGRRPLGVTSNAARRHGLSLLTGAGFDGAFDVIVSGDDVQHPKPTPDLYLHACQRLHAAPSTAIAVEDSPAGARSPRAAGLYAIAIPNSPSAVLDADLLAESLASPHVRAALGLPATPARWAFTRPARAIRGRPGPG